MIEHSPTTGRTPAIVVAGIVLIIAAVVSIAFLLWNKQHTVRHDMQERAALAKSGDRVSVAVAKRSAGSRSITLTGEARPYAFVTLYAKVSGYVKDIPVDKGDRLAKGQIVAVIESPELDAQYAASLADAQNKRRDAHRARTQLAQNAISIQDAERAEALADQADAGTEALRVQKDYQVIRAPFPAVVTARFVDPGALVQSAVTSQTTTLPVAAIAMTDRLRIYIYLDQTTAAEVRVGDKAVITDPARPAVRLSGTISRASGQLDDRTRTLLAEIDVDNRRGLILPGSFVSVILFLKMPPAVEIPAAALMTKNDQDLVAVLDRGNVVRFRPVIVVSSDARRVRLASGLEEGETIILNPGFGLLEGGRVQPQDAQVK